MPKILVIENEKAIQEDIADLLEMEGHEVFLAGDGEAGLASATGNIPDLIISDVMMPKMDGFEMIRWLKKEPTTSAIPVLFLTALVERPSVRRGMELGAEDYLTKPFTTAELLTAIESLLRKRAQIIERYVSPLQTIEDAIAHSLPHEFRTPLYGIIASGELLTLHIDGLDKEQIKELGETILTSGQRLHRVIEHYLLFAQLELIEASGKKLHQQQEYSMQNPNSLVSGIVREEAHRCGRQKDVALELHHNHPLQIEAGHFTKAFTELLDNALKFSELGQAIRVQDNVVDNCYTLTFADQGPGMSAQEIANIGQYKQFHRTKYEQQGIGLGLTLAAKIAHIYRGRLVVSCREGGGLIQRLELPLARFTPTLCQDQEHPA